MGTVAGIPVDPITGQPKSEEGLLALKKQEEEEAVGFDPLHAAALSAGASLLRNSGWRRRPMTFGEQIGHAIPAGMEAYYNQDALNQNEQQALYDRQQAEAQALEAKQKVEDDARLEAEKRSEFMLALRSAKLKIGVQQELIGLYGQNPDKAYEVLNAYTKKPTPEVKEIVDKRLEDGRVIKVAIFKDGSKKEFDDLTANETSAVEEFELRKKEVETKLLQGQQVIDNAKNKSVEDRQFEYLKHENLLIQRGIENGLSYTKILQSGQQFRETLKQNNEQFTQRIGLDQLIQQAQASQWEKEFNNQVLNEGETRKLAAERLQAKIIQDGITNGFKSNEIENQVTQFYDKLGLEKEGLNLKENIFKHQVTEDNRNYVKDITQYNSTLDQQQLEHKDKVAFQNRAQDQAVVEHLALIKQRGIENGLDAEKIALEQEKFIASTGQFREKQDLDVLIYRANVENQAANLAQDITEFIYKKGRDAKGDIRTDAEWKQQLKEYEDKLTQQTFNNFQKIQGHDLKVDIFKADVELKKLKLATEGNQPPRTLVGQAAIDWAGKEGENSPYTPKEGHTPVIKLNKHGQFESIEYLSQAKYEPSQQTFLTRSREKWSTDTEVKAANKITRLVTSLDALAKDGTGVSEFAMIYKFMKSLDETSTVLASEFRNAAGAGLGALDRLMLLGQKQWSGKQLTEDQQAHIIQAVRSVAYSRLAQMNTKQATYLADAKENGISNEDAVKMYPNELATYFENNEYTPAKKQEDKLVEKVSAASPTGAAMMAGVKYNDYVKQNPELNTNP